MSGFDPLSAIMADAALGQSAVAAIDLGVQIEILQSQIALGDLIAATILPPQSGSDLLSFLGQTVLAQLPPGVDPGQSLLLQVTGFSGNQILVRNIGVIDPSNPPQTITVTLPQPKSGTTAQATLVTVNNPSGAALPPSPELTPQAPTSAPQSVAPPRAVFVAASVKPAPPADAQTPRAVLPPAAVEELGLEARIAATRAAAIDLSELVAASNPKTPAQLAAPRTSTQAGAAATPPRAQPVVPPRITPAGASAASVAPERSEPIAPELALLARLRIPLLPFTIAAARVANTAAGLLPRALARLDAALAAVADGDARASTVRTIAAFLEKIDLGNARALPEQLMAYVSNVVDSAESKLAAILRALPSEAEGLPPEGQLPTPEAQPPPGAAPDASVALSVSSDAGGVTPNLSRGDARQQLVTTPQAVERATALQYDLKAAIASMIDTPPRGAPPQLAAALGDAMTAFTGVQLNVLNAQSTDPNTIVIPLPVFYHDGGRPVQLRISRDTPNGKGKLDADNFHIAFVLDTKSLGTVAVDVQTASRSVSVNVKTEQSKAADRFKETFGDLRGRLEQLHYRVANVAASVAPHARPPTTADGAHGVTLSAAPVRREVEAQPKRLDVQA